MTGRAWTAKERDFLHQHQHRPAAWLAEQLHRSVMSVRMAMKRWKLARTRPTLLHWRLEFLDAYRQGLSDTRIAERLGIAVETARSWRLRLKLPSHGRTEWVRQEMEQGRRVFRQNPDYRAEELEFMRAVDAARRAVGRQLSWPEVLRVAQSLGWRK